MKLTTATFLFVFSSAHAAAQELVKGPEAVLEAEVHRPAGTDAKPIEIIVPPITRIDWFTPVPGQHVY